MKIIEKLKTLIEDEFDPFVLMDIKNWPNIPLYAEYDDNNNPIPEDDPEMEPLDLENFYFVEVNDSDMIIKCGGDWQEPHKVVIELDSNNELNVVSFETTEFISSKEEIDINTLFNYES